MRTVVCMSAVTCSDDIDERYYMTILALTRQWQRGHRLRAPTPAGAPCPLPGLQA